MEKVESILPSSLWHQLTRIWPRPNRTGHRIRPRTRSRPPSRQKQLNWNPELCVGLDWHTFVPRVQTKLRTDEDGRRHRTKKAKQQNPELVLTLFDMFAFFWVFNHLKLFFCCTKRGDQLPSLKKSEKTKKYNKGLFVYCCNPASSRHFDSHAV